MPGHQHTSTEASSSRLTHRVQKQNICYSRGGNLKIDVI